MKVRAVLFDAAETLFTTRGSVGEIYGAAAREYGSKAELEAIQAAFVRNFHGAGPVSVENQKLWWKDIVRRVFTEVGMVETFDNFFDQVYDTFRNSQGWLRIIMRYVNSQRRGGPGGGGFETNIYGARICRGADHSYASQEIGPHPRSGEFPPTAKLNHLLQLRRKSAVYGNYHGGPGIRSDSRLEGPCVRQPTGRHHRTSTNQIRHEGRNHHQKRTRDRWNDSFFHLPTVTIIEPKSPQVGS